MMYRRTPVQEAKYETMVYLIGVILSSPIKLHKITCSFPARRGTLILKQENTFNIYYQRRLSENCCIGLHYKLLGRYVVSLQTILLCLYQEFPDKTSDRIHFYHGFYCNRSSRFLGEKSELK